MPMVWYIPPLSPVVDALTETGHDGEDAGNLFGAIDALRIPVEYLAELFTAGDTDRVTRRAAPSSAAMRSYMRDLNLGRPADESIAAAVGMTGRGHRGHAPAAGHRQVRRALRHPARARRAGRRGSGGARRPAARWTTTGGPGMGGWGPFGETSGGADADRGGELPHAARSGRPATPSSTRATRRQRVNLLNWDGKGAAEGLFPPRSAEATRTAEAPQP